MAKMCIVCHSQSIQEVVEQKYCYFYCDTCNKLYERAYDPDYGRDVAIPNYEGVSHVVAGTILWHGNRFLLLKRRVFAFGYSFPAGHVEYRETPLDTIKREVEEETSLKVTQSKLVFEDVIPNHKCRYGADHHYWYFYESEFEPGEIILNPESETYGWFTKDEAKKLDLVPQARAIYDRLFP